MPDPTLADLMHPAPSSWGLRGDPMLFDAMCEVFKDHPLPRDEATLRTAFLNTFEILTGTALADAPPELKVSWTRRETGGMSNGFVAPGFWQDRFLPELLRRWKEQRASTSGQ